MATTESYEDFLGQILRPMNSPSLKYPVVYDSVRIEVYRNPLTQEPSEEFEFDDIYPFHTLSDLSVKLYKLMEFSEDYHPSHQCYLLPTKDGKYTHIQYLFGSQSYELESPFTRVKGGPDQRFVDLEGNPKLTNVTNRNSMLLEKTLFHKEKDVYTLHLYLYKDILKAYPGLQPINRADWEGIFKVYFPLMEKQFEDGIVPEDAITFAQTKANRFEARQIVLEKLEENLRDKPLRKPGESAREDAINLNSLRNLRIAWKGPQKSPAYQTFRVESVFYDMKVSERVPYIRYFPKSATPISKIHVDGPFNIPTLEDPEILLQWSKEQAITPNEDMLMVKLLLRPGIGSVPPLYATFLIFEDGSAKLVIQPPVGMKSLSRQGDLFQLVSILEEFTASLPKLQLRAQSAALGLAPLQLYTAKNCYLEDAYLVLGLRLEREETQITRKSLYSMLPFFRPFFQVTSSPLKEQNPIAFLRYKAVSDFRTPSRDYQFLNRIMDLQKLSGATNLRDFVKYYMEEFDVPESLAASRVRDFLEDATKYSLVDPEVLEFTQTENPGIDMAIFGKESFYTFHLYRVDSILTLRRIKTLLSLLLSLEPADFEEAQRSASTLGEEEEEEKQEAEAEAADASVDEEVGVKEVLAAAAVGEAVADGVGDHAAGDFYDELGGFDGFGDELEAPAEAKPPSKPLAKLVQEDGLGGEAAVIPPPVAATKSKKSKVAATEDEEEELGGVEDDEDEIKDPEEFKTMKAKTYFQQRLQYYDKKLFSYHKDTPGIKKYARMCGSTPRKQPAVLSEDEYSRMKEIYEEDEAAGKVLWIEYPLKKGQAHPRPESSKTEVITTLRYGSNLLPGQANIFICSLYWCRKDELVILKADFEGTVDRKGRPKDPMSCPFCRGTLVTDRKAILKGQTVIERVSEDAKHLRHLFVTFLKKTPHPDNLFLPCCALKDHIIKEDEHKAFSHLKKQVEQLVPAEPAKRAPPPPKSEAVIYATDYKKRMGEITTSYITGAEKFPLEVAKEGPQIGIVPKAVDTFFAQNSYGELVKQDHTVWRLMTDNLTGLPNVSGFFRIGVENRKSLEAESFFSALAPYYGENSAAAIKRRIQELIQPNTFLELNYGNFLFDFYDPAAPPPPITVLKRFAHDRLLMDSGLGIQKEGLVRLWKAYVAFEKFMSKQDTVKEYRQFAQFLAAPDLMFWSDETGARSRGILFIVLEYNRSGVLEVKCPPYGVTPAMMDPETGCDVAFILHYTDQNIWEPLFYSRNQASKGIFQTTMIFRRDARADWPEIVRRRVQEFEDMCKKSGLGIYTDSWAVNPQTLLPIGKVLESIDIEVYAILRDTYNHVSAVLFLDGDKIISVPVIDDGTLHRSTKVELDWRNFMKRLATVEQAKTFYESKILPLIDTFPAAEASLKRPSYTIQSIIRLDKTMPERSDIYALHLAGGLFVPVSKPEGDGAGVETVETETNLGLEEGQELPWMIDTKLAFGKVAGPSVQLEVDHKEFEEIYQHLRVTFANWIAVSSGSMKQEINSILYKDGRPNNELPLFEKRQRLFIKFGNEILSWLDSSIPVRDRKPSIKRVDCRVQSTQETCSNRCVWKADTSTCLLHTPETFTIGSRPIDAKMLLVRKLLEELIRFPDKRQQILNNMVSQYVKLTEPFRSGNEYIVPENLPAWSEMLRMEWKRKARVEAPKYVEEFWEAGTAAAPVEEKEPMPDVLSSYIGKSDIPLTFIHEPSNSVFQILKSMGVVVEDLEEKGQDLTHPLLDSVALAKQVGRALKFSIYQVAYPPSNPVASEPIMVKGLLAPTKKAPVLILVQLPDGRIGSVSSTGDSVVPVPFDLLPANLKGRMGKVSPTIMAS